MPFYVVLVDATHHIVQANRTLSTILGKELGEFVGAYCPRVMHGLDHPFPGCPLEEVVAMPTPCPVERELFDSKSERWIRSAVYPTGQVTPAGHAIFLHMVQDITEQKLATHKLGRKRDEQGALNALLRLSVEDISLPELLGQALDLILALPWLTLEAKGSLFLVEDDPGMLVMQAQAGLAAPVQQACARVLFGQCLCGRAALTQEVQYAARLDERHAVRYEGMKGHGHYCVPLVCRGKTLGVINTYLKEGHKDDPEERDFLVSAANTLAGVIARRRTDQKLRRSLDKLQRSFTGTIMAISKISEEIDQYTSEHQKHVAQLARAIAAEMGLDEQRREGIEVAGLVHDIGKVTIASSILSKPGRLNDFEMGLIRTHPQTGYNILKEVEFPWPIAQAVLQHHERLDGSGYPRQLRGEQILLEARIIAVADVFEAMSSHRPYRPALGVEAALAELREQTGTRYDPLVVETCLRLVAQGFQFT